MALWIKYFSEVMRENQYDDEFARMLQGYEATAEVEASNHLQPWLYILDDSIQWLANLWAILERELEASNKKNRLRSVWALLGASTAHAVAVRRLILSGLDTPARAIARALDEHLCACIAVLHDGLLAEGFQKSQDVKDAKKFWHSYLNTQSVRKVLSEVESDIGLEPEISRDMRAWRDWEVTALSQAIHPSFVNAALTVKTADVTNPEVHVVSIFGKASAGSERTLNFVCKSIWYFSRLGFYMLYNEHRGQPPLILVQPDDEMHQVAVIGRDVLSALNIKYWSHEIYTLEPEA